MLVASNSTDGEKQGTTAEDTAEVCIELPQSMGKGEWMRREEDADDYNTEVGYL